MPNVDECVSQHGTLFGLKKFEIFHAYRYRRFEVFQRQQNVFQKYSPCIQRSIRFKTEIFLTRLETIECIALDPIFNIALKFQRALFPS